MGFGTKIANINSYFHVEENKYAEVYIINNANTVTVNIYYEYT